MAINWERRAQRERAARIAAEQMLETRSEQLYEANQALERINRNQSDILADQSQQLDRRRFYESLLNQSFSLLLDASLVVPKRVLGKLLQLLDEQQPFRLQIGWQGRWYSANEHDFEPVWRGYSWQQLGSGDSEVRKAGGQSGIWCQSMEHQIALLFVSDQPKLEEAQSWFVRSMLTSLEAFAVNVQAYQQLQQAQQQTAHMAQVRYRFLASVTHELRTPLNGMLASTDLLLESQLNPQQLELLNIINLSGQSLLALINDVLDYAKIEDGGFALNPQANDLQQLVTESLEVVRPQAQEQGNQLNLNWRGVAPCVVSVDALRFKQILLNLLSNAIKFTRQGRIDVDIDATPQQQHCQLQLAIRDSGCGIERATIAKIFKPFAQAAGAEHRGTGLGLAICNHLCQVMGSKLEVQSTPGVGSTFSFTLLLPFATVQQQEEAPEDYRLDGVRLLLVDDTRANQLVAKLMLEKVGATVALASDGLEAIAQEQQQPFDLILMDCRMPKMDGFDCTEQLRSNGCRLPIIALTATTTDEDLQRCHRVGMNDVLYKPIQKAVMLAKIQQHLAPVC
ncbi:response regulator [Ferrimonas senticii]|uniref:response regulator n=1 Tax=Ferrimonas senticii TaxID=394566 RepID=UPI0004039023|nr:response regulator [Ferrimonas senticii]